LCDPNPCPQPVYEGACCFEDGSCMILTADDCLLQGGAYQGDDTLCDPNPCPVPQNESCGLGYWKNHEDSWIPTGYTPEDLVGGIFTIPAELDLSVDDTLYDALRYPGGNGASGGARLLLRTAVVALLNSAHPDVNFPITVAEIVVIVNDALATLNKRDMLDARHEIDQHTARGAP